MESMHEKIRNYDVQEVYEAGKRLIKESKGNSRYLSWQHCYNEFEKIYKEKKCGKIDYEKIDYDFLALHLGFYLASWGMYRGSTFLLNYDYKIHTIIVKEVIKNNIDLIGKDINIDTYNELKENIEQQYPKYKSNNEATETLVTKILLGTLGCIPAYDRYFKSAIKYCGCPNVSVSKESLEWLDKFYEKLAKKIESDDETRGILEEYPKMKIIDMFFWQFGKELENKIIFYGEDEEAINKLKEELNIKYYKNEEIKDSILNISSQGCFMEIKEEKDKKYEIKYKKNNKLYYGKNTELKIAKQKKYKELLTIEDLKQVIKMVKDKKRNKENY